MKVNQIKAGTLLSYVQMILSVLISLVYTPTVLKLLGQSEYGLYQTVYSTVNMLNMLNLGLNISYVHFFTKYKERKDRDGMARYNGLYLTVLAVLGLIVLTIGLVMTQNIEGFLADGLTADEYVIARKLMLLLVVNTAISFPMSTFTGIISASECFVFLKTLAITKTVVSHGISIAVLYAGYRSVGLVCTTVVISFVVDVIYLAYAFIKLKSEVRFGKTEKGLLKGLMSYTAFIAINVFVDQINLNIDKVVLARLRGTKEVAIYNIGFLIFTYYQSLSTAITSVLAPRVHKLVYETKDDPEKQGKSLTELCIKVGRIQFLLLSLFATGFLLFGKAFITEYWASTEYETSYYVALILIISVTGPLIQNVGITILQALNMHRFRSILYAGIACCNLVVSIFLCQAYGVIGSTIGTAFALLLGNVLIINIYYHKKVKINVFRFWRTILRVSLGFLIPLAAGTVYCTTVDLSKPVWFVLGIAGYSVIYGASIWLLSMNAEEKQLLTGFCRKISKRKAK